MTDKEDGMKVTTDYDDGGIKVWIDGYFRGKFTHDEAKEMVSEFVFHYGVDVTHPKNTEQANGQ